MNAPERAAAADRDRAAERDGIADLLPEIEAALAAACQWSPRCPERLAGAMRYSLLAPGKRIRPALVLMACEAVDGNRTSAHPGAVAVEMVHAYSLVHDDLPAMDNDDLRRGRPTTHIAFDEATAILAGDALLASAFEHLATQVPDPIASHRCLAALARASGPEFLVGGQVEDVAAESGGEQTLQRLEAIHRGKTGALIDVSVMLGAILGGAEQRAIEALQCYSRPLGLAFQVVDDCLDHCCSADDMGKRTGKDAARGKLTYPGLMGLENATAYARQLIDEALASIAVFGDKAWRLEWLAEFVRDRTR
jgi:geranylgeranyl diphosphate synthase, type II